SCPRRPPCPTFQPLRPSLQLQAILDLGLCRRLPRATTAPSPPCNTVRPLLRSPRRPTTHNHSRPARHNPPAPQGLQCILGMTTCRLPPSPCFGSSTLPGSHPCWVIIS